MLTVLLFGDFLTTDSPFSLATVVYSSNTAYYFDNILMFDGPIDILEQEKNMVCVLGFHFPVSFFYLFHLILPPSQKVQLDIPGTN